MHINPDHFLATADGRITTPERNAWAWTRCYEELSIALEKCEPNGALYVLVGAQGAGKSTCARERKKLEPNCVIFDAILVKRSERAPILRKAQTAGVEAIAVWFQTPLHVCLARNAARPTDEIANETGLRNVYAAVEPPSEQEGFSSVIFIHSGA